VQKAGELRPALVLMDIKLKGEMDGIEAAEQIRARLDIPVVYLTAYDDDATLRRARISEPFGYILKPFKAGDLSSTIEMALYKHEMDQKLKESEEWFRALVENSSDVTTVVTADGTLRYASPSHERLVGYSPDELIGTHPLDFVHPDDLQRGTDAFAKVLQTPGATAAVRFRTLHRNGSWRWIESTSSNQLDNPAVSGIVGNSRDITERVRVEEALHRYADEQAALYAITSAATAFLDPDELLSTVLDVVLSILDSDAGWVILPGPTADDLPRVAVWRGIPESFLATKEAIPLRTCMAFARLPTSGEALPESILMGEWPRLSAEVLSSVDLHSHVGIPLSVGQRVFGILNVGWHKPRPRTEADLALLTAIGRQVGLALRNAQLYQAARQVNRLQALNAISAAAVSSLDRDTVLRRVLELTCQALGADEGSILLRDPDTEELVFELGMTDDAHNPQGGRLAPGQGIAGWVAEHGQSVCVNDVRRDSRFCGGVDALAGFETPSLLGAPLIRRDEISGVIEIVSKRAGGFDDEDLSLLEAVSSIAAAAIENTRLYDELKTLLREREEAHAQSIHTEKMAALGRLAASLAHEINNPLQSVIGCLGLAEEGLDEGKDLGRYLEVARQEVRRVARTVAQMRDLYRPALEEREPAEVNALLGQVLELSRKRCQESGVEVVWRPATGLPPLVLAPDQIKQVLLNLLLNALEAMRGGGRLEVSTAYTDQPAGVRIDFTDSGLGIAADVLPHIFEPFYSTKPEGTGLGLSTSHSIVERHGGHIEVDSQVGKGSTFSVWLPI